MYCIKLVQSYKKIIKRPSVGGENVLVGGFSVFLILYCLLFFCLFSVINGVKMVICALMADCDCRLVACFSVCQRVVLPCYVWV